MRNFPKHNLLVEIIVSLISCGGGGGHCKSLFLTSVLTWVVMVMMMMMMMTKKNSPSCAGSDNYNWLQVLAR